MITMNVHPEWRIKNRQRKLLGDLLVLGACVASTWWLGDFGGRQLVAQTAAIQQGTTLKKKAMEDYKLNLSKVEKLKKDIELIHQKTASVEGLTRGAKQIVRMLATLQDTHLPSIQFDSLVVQGDKVTIEGGSSDHGLIANYVRMLKQHTSPQQALVHPQGGEPHDPQSSPVEFSKIQLTSKQQDARTGRETFSLSFVANLP